MFALLELGILMLASPFFLCGLITLGIVCEHTDHRGWSTFFALIIAVVALFYFKPSVDVAAMALAAYAVMGALWSAWRYKRHLQIETAKIISKKLSTDSTSSRLDALHPKEMAPTLTAWVIIWPLSMIERISGDLYDVVSGTIVKLLEGMFARTYAKAMAAAKEAQLQAQKPMNER